MIRLRCMGWRMGIGKMPTGIDVRLFGKTLFLAGNALCLHAGNVVIHH